MRTVRWCLVAGLTAGLALTGAPPAAATQPGAAPGDPVVRGIDLELATVLDLQDAMDRRQLSSVHLTGFYLSRIRTLDPLLHAVIETSPQALRDATASDLHRRRHGARSPLEGIPVLLKDNLDTAATARLHTTAGSFALLDARPDQDAFLVARLRQAGAVVLGKANLSEWANFRSTSSSSGWSARGGQVNNPYVLDRNPCGSSSGSAVAASAHLATVTIGTETNGSIVCPASANSTVGLKPTLGLVSRSGIVPISAQQDTAGPITRTVTDAAAVLSVVQGVDPEDPATGDAADFVDRDYLQALEPDALAGKRIGVWREPAAENPEVAAVLDDAVDVLRDRGATIVDNVELAGLDEVLAAQLPALLVEFKHDLNAYLAATPGDHPADLAGLIAFNNEHADLELPFFGQEIFELAEATGGDLTDPEYLQQRATATNGAQAMIDDAVAAHDLDAIVAPTNNAPWLTDLENGDDFTGFVSSSGPAAISGYPNLTVPGGYVRGELPLGVNFFGGRFSEPTLVAVGFAFEQATQVRRLPSFLPTLPEPAGLPAPAGGAAG
ncbi:MAG: amidase [Micromonosporaceae bacterium]|nr:amidase [Micromonosporaceae bacterium]